MHVTPTTASNYVAFKPDPLRTYTLRTYSESNIDPNSSGENNNEASTLTSSTSKGGGGWIMKQYVFARERYTLKTPLHYILSNIHEKSYGSSMAKRKNTAVLNMASLNMLLRYADVSDREGRLPLHYAVLYNGHGTSLGGVRYVLFLVLLFLVYVFFLAVFIQLFILMNCCFSLFQRISGNSCYYGHYHGAVGYIDQAPSVLVDNPG